MREASGHDGLTTGNRSTTAMIVYGTLMIALVAIVAAAIVRIL
jgi:hypothetical protein